MRLKIFYIIVCVLLMRGGVLSCSAQTVSMSVDSLFRLIDNSNRNIRLKSLCVDNAEAGENVARSKRLPSIGMSLSVGYLGNGFLTDRDFSDGISVRNPHSNNNFAIEAMQMIYSGGAITSGIRMSELNSHVARLDLEQSRQQVRFLLLGWLIDLHCLNNHLRVIDENVALARQVLDNVKARFDEGVALQNDITRYELQLQDLQLQRSRTEEAVRTTNYRLANALDMQPAVVTIIPDLSLIDDTFDIGPECNWHDLALESSLSLKKAGLGIDISKTNLRIISAEKRPKVSLFAYGKFDSPVVIEVPVLNKNFMYWGFGVNLSFNISSLYTADKRERQARISVAESREAYEVGIENLQNDIQEAYERYGTAVTELQTKQKGLELACRNYDVVNERFDNGMALVTDMVDAANIRLSSEIGLENARTSLLFCYYRLKYITNTL